MTYTYAVLDVPATVYAAVRALLKAAEYEHAFHQDGSDEVIDMHGIALRSDPVAVEETHDSILMALKTDRAAIADFLVSHRVSGKLAGKIRRGEHMPPLPEL